MGQYYVAMNARKREIVDPSKLGECLKAWWRGGKSRTRDVVESLIASGVWNRADVTIQGDEGLAFCWCGQEPTDHIRQWSDDDAEYLFADITERADDDHGGKRMKVYIVTWGSYSDKRVVAVRSVEGDAGRIALAGDDGRVQPWEVDAEPMPEPGLMPWHVSMGRDGDAWRVQLGHVTNFQRADYDTPCLVTDAWDDYTDLCVNCWARDREHAVKIANDIRAQRIASGAWA